MTNEDFKKLKRRALEDLEFNEDNAIELSAKVPNLYQKYLSDLLPCCFSELQRDLVCND